ncbi:CU044_5270 family protein [Actinomadura violacea]|uniref:CU044_5270 family protein n=1 Tax=Actinomadura violacea TaxID=2819934 RepID=A0ABS3RNM6_9ACTN|nr:CU044_5270 family protein [Actinomadura violacea]MBO2458362.1 CU044_5270 family protein [Actinomadura violacea]
MNEIDLVREVFGPPRPTEQDTAAALAKVRKDIDGGAEPRRARGLAVPSRRRWIGGFGLTAVTAAAAVAVSLWGTAPGPDRHRATPPPPAARTVLLAAARQADLQDDTMGEYWHDASVSRLYYRMHAPTGDYTVVWARRSEGWTPSDPAGRDCGRRQDLGTRPAGSADEAAWRRAGSPAAFTIPTGRKGFAPMTLKLAAGPSTTTCRSLPRDGTIFSLGGNVTMKDLRSLPADPDRLRRLLIQRFGRAGADTEPLTRTKTGDSWLFSVARDIILDMPVTPRVRAAAFRMIADLPSVRTIGPVRDAEGRRGTAVAIDEHTSGGDLEHRLVIDEASGRALAYEQVVLRPAGENAGRAPGSLINSVVNLAAGWSGTAPR